MSPDEYLLVMPYAEVTEVLAKLAKSLVGEHHLAVNVSDARAIFRIEGEKATDVLRKLSPVDFDTLEPGELRQRHRPPAGQRHEVVATMLRQQGFVAHLNRPWRRRP